MQMPGMEFLLGMAAGAGVMIFLRCALQWKMRLEVTPSGVRQAMERHAEVILENLPVPVFIKSSEGAFLMVNHAFEVQTGVSARTLVGTDGDPYWPREQIDSRLAHEREIFKTGEMASSELQITGLTKQETRQFLTYKKPVFDDAGHPLYLIGACVDITECKLAESALRESNQRWMFALEGTGDGVCEWDMQTGIVMFSARWKSILGFDEADIGVSLDEWRTRIHPDDAVRVAQTLQRYLDEDVGTYINEHRVCCKDGSYKWLLVRAMVTDRDERQQPLRMISISTDITVTRQTESARLAHMARQRDVLVAEVHHRIKNSLQGVVGLLRQHKNADHNAAPTIDRAIAQVQTISLVYGLQGQSFASEVVLCEMVPGIARNLETLLLPKPLFDIQVDVPKRIRVNEQEAVPLALIVNELIVNAVKHSQEKSQTSSACIGISVGWDRSAQQARILIRNNGRLAPGFDFANSRGIGTGLDLVRLLLPPEGASLSFSSTNDQVEVLLSLDTPSIHHLNV